MARAYASFPVPLSPTRRNGIVVGASSRINLLRGRMDGESPRRNARSLWASVGCNVLVVIFNPRMTLPAAILEGRWNGSTSRVAILRRLKANGIPRGERERDAG